MTKDDLFEKAVAAGCHPFWHDGIYGPAWYCGCSDLRHASDQQCSMITAASIEREIRKENVLNAIGHNRVDFNGNYY